MNANLDTIKGVDSFRQ